MRGFHGPWPRLESGGTLMEGLDNQSLSAGPQSSFQAMVPPSVTAEDPEPWRDDLLKGLKSGQRGSRTFRTFVPVTTDLTGGLEPECPLSAGGGAQPFRWLWTCCCHELYLIEETWARAAAKCVNKRVQTRIPHTLCLRDVLREGIRVDGVDREGKAETRW